MRTPPDRVLRGLAVLTFSGLILSGMTACGASSPESEAPSSETTMAATTSTDGATATPEPNAVESGASSSEPSKQTLAPGGSRAPKPGSTDGLSTAPTKDRPTLAAVKPKKTATSESGVSVSLRSWSSVTMPAGAPGEIGGPGVAISLRVVNDSKNALDLSNVVVDLRTGKSEVPAIRADREPTQPFTGQLAPGESATAIYAFRVDRADRDRVTVLVSLNDDVPIVAFKGSLTQS